MKSKMTSKLDNKSSVNYLVIYSYVFCDYFSIMCVSFLVSAFDSANKQCPQIFTHSNVIIVNFLL